MTSGEGLKLVFTESPVATIVIDRQGQVADVNRAAIKTMARGRDRLIGTPILSWVVPEDRDMARDQFVKSMEGRSGDWTVRVRRGDGIARVLSLRTVPLDRGGQAQGILAFARDLSPPQEGRPDAGQLQALLESLPGQFVVALDRTGRIRYSSGLSRTHLVPDENYVGEPFGVLVCRDSRNVELTDYLLEELKVGREWGGLLWYHAVDGTRVPVRTFASPYRDPKSGRILGGLVAGRDVRRELKLRDDVERSQRLASIGRLVGDVAGALSSELEAASDGAAVGGSGAESTGGATPAPASLPALDRLRRFLEGLGEYASEPQRDFDAVPVADVIDAALVRHRTRPGAPEVEMTRSGEAGPSVVYADNAQLGRVFDILIENARESLAGRSDRRVRIDVAQGVEGLVVRVSDSGAGLDPGCADTIFEPFFTTKPGHAGLGLSIARAIVDSFSGRLWAEVDEDWTTFVLELRSKGREASIPFTIAPARGTRSRTILLVDDEEAVRQSIRKFLEKVGYEVREAWSGRSALAQVTAGDPPELILTDLKMADGSGYWFLTEVARDFPDLIRKTVVLTGEAQSDDAARLLRETGCPIIPKPVELSHLLDILEEVTLAS